ncbi:hypothetical protein [Flavobacterium hibisci]|uniref:hypothetical protein n=1 Tax=Flavobacterium hibisci TaxID=1914462 RepID=UPI001CC11D50|nr:hypothetical protein [Flavobacterium hibisci]MBZ4043854.1 hypothetical protein [Flavobacterium hibisci]
MKEQEIVNAFCNYYIEELYDLLEVKFIFTLGGSYDIYTSYYKDGNKINTDLDGRELFFYENQVSNFFKSKIATKEKFNIVIFKIKDSENYSISYHWENSKEKQDLLNYAEVFYQWVNERMMSMLFEYEKDNNLLPTQYDDDGDLDYLSSWDSGIFTFHISNKNELKHNIVLTKDGKERTVEMPLKDYFIEGLLEHHSITNNELSDEWKPWNTMILKSLHYDIPYDKREEFVSYLLE